MNTYINQIRLLTDSLSLQYGTGDASLDLIVIGGALLLLLFLVDSNADFPAPAGESAPQPAAAGPAVTSGKKEEPLLASNLSVTPAQAIPDKKLSSKLSKSRGGFLGKISAAFSKRGREREAVYEELEEILLSSDVGVKSSQELLQALRTYFANSNVPFSLEEARKCLEGEVERILEAPIKAHVPSVPTGPKVILVLGVNGAGKTTSIGKLSHQFRAEGKRVMVVAADTFRAAAVEQLQQWAERTGALFVRGPDSCKPAGVVFDGVKQALEKKVDVVLLDTAGRLQNKTNLMQELKGVYNSIKRHYPEAPHETYLVIDGVSGQNGLFQAKEFNEVAPLTGIIITKLDSTSKGGITLALSAELGVPIRYIGVGEGPEDLRQFDAKEFSSALIGEADTPFSQIEAADSPSAHGAVRRRRRTAG